MTSRVRVLLPDSRGAEDGDKTEHGKLEEERTVRRHGFPSDVAPRRQGREQHGCRQGDIVGNSGLLLGVLLYLKRVGIPRATVC